MKILALEMSSPRGSIALLEDDGERFAVEFANDRKHSGLFFENLQRCVSEYGNADRIVVGLGPGSYAGTRIAIAAAIGIAAASGAQLGGLPSLITMPTDAPEYAVIGDARRQSFFFALVRQWHCAEGPLLENEDELAERLRGVHLPVFTTEPLPRFPNATVLHPSAKILAQLSAGMVPAPLEPIYLREPHITQPKSR